MPECSINPRLPVEHSIVGSLSPVDLVTLTNGDKLLVVAGHGDIRSNIVDLPGMS